MIKRLALALLLFVPAPATAEQPSPDALTQRVLSELKEFTDWLTRFGVKGYIGEVGWPDDRRRDAHLWQELAKDWYDEADRNDLWVTYWATGEWWGDKYILAAYEDRDRKPGVESFSTQAAVVESHSGRHGRGIVDAGGEFGYAPTTQRTSRFSNENPGRYNRAYHYDNASTFRYLFSRHMSMVKIPFRWERLQPKPGGRLEAAELRRLKGAVERAGKAGLEVVLDMHNFGAYYVERSGRGHRCAIGQPDCTVRDFADVWSRIAREFRADPYVIAYTLMTEPVAMKAIGSRSAPEVWRHASQAAVTAMRKAGETDATLFVSGYHWSGAQGWSHWNPEPWITDPSNLIRYEAHHYWDGDHSGTYRDSYFEESENAESG